MPSRGHAIEVRRLRPAGVLAGAEAADVGVTEIVGVDDDDVRRPLRHGGPGDAIGWRKTERDCEQGEEDGTEHGVKLVSCQ